MATACLGVVRFACTIPLAFVGIDGSKMYEAVKGLDALGIYDVIPGGRMFLSGLQMYATWVGPVGEAQPLALVTSPGRRRL
jgi:hypothetical protein